MNSLDHSGAACLDILKTAHRATPSGELHKNFLDVVYFGDRRFKGSPLAMGMAKYWSEGVFVVDGEDGGGGNRLGEQSLCDVRG